MCQNDIFYRAADDNALTCSLGLGLESPHFIYIYIYIYIYNSINSNPCRANLFAQKFESNN